MRILIYGQGEREKWLAGLCPAHGHTVAEHGPWDAAVLPLPRSSVTEAIADQLPRGQQVICGLTDAGFDELAQRRGWKLLRVLQEEEYTLENAALTAEGAVFAAAGRMKKALRDADCLVIGYGRIGKELTRLLRGMGAAVTVAARREESRRAAGESSIPLTELPAVLQDMDAVFNTVPAQVLGKKELEIVDKDCILIELASAPYGIDLDAAREMGLNASLESGLPGRYCPESAAEALLSYLEREVSHE